MNEFTNIMNFLSLEDVGDKIERWLRDCNTFVRTLLPQIAASAILS